MNVMRFTYVIIGVISFFDVALAQDKSLKKSWIKTDVEDLTKKMEGPDTSYMRYVFGKDVILYGFEPTSNNVQMPYVRKGKELTLGFDQWIIEELTDSSLTIYLSGFRRIHFLAENYLQNKQEYLVQVGDHKGKPLYKANQIITPRYKKANPLHNDILKQDRADDYNIRKAGVFMMSFIVTEDGNIEEPKIIRSVVSGYDNNVIKELLKTSKRWIPATFKGKPVQTLVIFKVEFLDSLGQH